jgi:hypothetical protein
MNHYYHHLTRVETVAIKQRTGELYFALIFVLHPDIQTRQRRVNKGPHTRASYKFTVRRLCINQKRKGKKKD